MAITREQILQLTGGSNRGADILRAAQQHGFSPQDVDRAFGLDAGTSQNWIAQNMAPQQQMPQTGLAGLEAALRGGMEGSLGALQQGAQAARQDLTQNYQAGLDNLNQRTDQAMGYLQPIAQTGGQAFDLMGALTGVLGGDAQAQAYQNFQASPGQQYLQEQAEKALLRNASALGGLGGGAVRNELQRQAIGMAAQDFDNSFNRLGQVAAPGLAAAGQQAGLAQNAGMAGLGAHTNLGNALGGISQSLGQQSAGIIQGTGQQLGGARYDTGNRLAGAIGDTTSALSALRNQQGAGLAEQIGANTGNLANLLTGASDNQANMLTQLAQLLGQYGMGQGSQLAGLPGIPGIDQTGGILGGLGSVLSGAGNFMYGWNNRGA